DGLEEPGQSFVPCAPGGALKATEGTFAPGRPTLARAGASPRPRSPEPVENSGGALGIIGPGTGFGPGLLDYERCCNRPSSKKGQRGESGPTPQDPASVGRGLQRGKTITGWVIHPIL